jgi:chemosensory pili system protein ChpA (sensor histidine kinase/response regulator)
MARWHRLDDAAWDRVRASFCAACVADARLSADSAAAAAAVYWAARATDYAAADAAAADAADADAAAADAAAAARAAAAAAARQACWVRLATALCDAIDAELAASAAKETT